MRMIGLLTLIFILLCQGAVARVHIGADMSLTMGTNVTAASEQSDEAEAMDCHQAPVVSIESPVPCHNDFGCDGDCGQCKIITATAAILPVVPIFPSSPSQRARAAVPAFTSVILFADSPPPSVC